MPATLTGTWQVVDLARSQDMLIFSVADPNSHKEEHVTFSREGLQRLKNGLEKAGLDAKFFAWPPKAEPGRAPYRGLQPLEAADAGIFFGRDAPIIEFADALRGLRAGAPPRLLVILAASGAGKSSLLRAGLLPRLARDDKYFLPLQAIRPERAALTGENGLLAALEAACPNRTRADLRAAIKAGAAGVRPLLAELAENAFRQTLAEAETGKPPTIVIAIDQAEELFRGDEAEEGAGLLDLVRGLTAGDNPAVIAIFAIRSDSYDALQNAKPLEGLPQKPLSLPPMPHNAYREVIEGPAERVVEAGGKLAIEPQLIDNLLDDIEKGAGEDALPLLAFTLEQLYLEYGRAGLLRLRDYRAFGGLKGTIDAAVERALRLADQDPRIPKDRGAREALLRRGLIPWLAGIDPDSKSPRRNIARRSDIPAEAVPLIDLLVEERLLSTDTVLEKDATGKEVFVATIEPAHEALLRQWGLLEGWLAEDFGLLATLEGVKRAARDWDANGRAEAWLAHQGPRLAETQSLDARPDIAARLDVTDRAYLAQCRAREAAIRAEKEEALKREQDRLAEIAAAQARTARLQRRARWTLAVFAAFVVAGMGLVYWQHATNLNLQASLNARQVELNREQTKLLAGLAAAERLRNNWDAALRLAAHGTRLDQHLDQAAGMVTPSPARAELAAALFQTEWYLSLSGHYGNLTSAAFSPDGKRIVTTSTDDTARVWDAVTGKTIMVLSGHDGAVMSAAFSPDGSRIVTGSLDKTARIWDAASGKPIMVLRGHTGGVWPVGYSPDGTRIVTGSYDKTARIWNASTGDQIAVLSGHTDTLRSAAFSPDGTRIVTGSSDGTARVWDAATAKQLLSLTDNMIGVSSARFSPDNTRIVTGSADKIVRIWDAKTGKELTMLRGHDAAVMSVSFSPDGSRIVSASFDQTARLWDVATKDTAVLRGHEGRLMSAAFSPDGGRIVTASLDDRTARLWEPNTIGKLIGVLRGHEGIVHSVGFSSDGSRIVTAGDDKTVRIWDAATERQIAALNGHTDAVWSAAFSPDGKRIVTGSTDKTLRIWDAASGNQIRILSGHEGTVWSVGFSPDGSRIVSGSADGTARVWDAASGKQIAVLRGQSAGANQQQEADFGIHSVSFSPDGKRILTGSSDDTAVSGMSPPDKRSLCCAVTRMRCGRPHSALTARKSSPGRETRPPACGTRRRVSRQRF